MKKRLIGSALVAVPIAIVIFGPFQATLIAIPALSVVGVHELLCATGFLHRNKRLIAYAMVFAALLPIWVFFGSPKTGATAGILLFTMLLFLEGITGSEEATFDKLCIAFFAAIVVPYFFSSFIRLLEMGGGNIVKGRLILLFPILGAFGCDVFSFFTGSVFGNRKLCPDISPKKTVEGAIGGFVMAPVVVLLYAMILDATQGYSISYINAIAVGFASAFAGIVGDLAMSLVKRRSGIKDFGKLIPGHGGVLDRFDSVLFAAPFVEIILLFLPVIL